MLPEDVKAVFEEKNQVKKRVAFYTKIQRFLIRTQPCFTAN